MSLPIAEEAIKAAAQRIMEIASLPNGLAEELAKAALEAGLPHCHSKSEGDGEPQRFMDEIDAATVANRWIEDIAYNTTGASRRLEYLQFERSNGGVVLFWNRNRLVAASLIVRDELNYSVMMRAGPFQIAALSPPVLQEIEDLERKLSDD